jgi:hypothetical protein
MSIFDLIFIVVVLSSLATLAAAIRSHTRTSHPLTGDPPQVRHVRCCVSGDRGLSRPAVAAESVTTSRVFKPPAHSTGLGLITGHGGPGCFIIGDDSSLFYKRTFIRLA